MAWHSNMDGNVCISEYMEPVYVYNPGKYILLQTVQQACLIALSCGANALPTRVKLVLGRSKREGTSVFWEIPSFPAAGRSVALRAASVLGG